MKRALYNHGVFSNAEEIISACSWREATSRNASTASRALLRLTREGEGFYAHKEVAPPDVIMNGMEYRFHFRSNLSGTVIVTRRPHTAGVFTLADRQSAAGNKLPMVAAIPQYWGERNQSYYALEIADSKMEIAEAR